MMCYIFQSECYFIIHKELTQENSSLYCASVLGPADSFSIGYRDQILHIIKFLLKLNKI